MGGFIYQYEYACDAGIGYAPKRLASVDEFIDALAVTNRPAHYHEVIHGPQKIKLDIDDDTCEIQKWFSQAAGDKDYFRDRIRPLLHQKHAHMLSCECTDDYFMGCKHSEEYSRLLDYDLSMVPDYAHWDEFIDTIRMVFHLTYEVDLSRKDIVICDSSDDTKFSRHIIINGYVVADHIEAKEFVSRLCGYLPKHLVDSKVIDMAVLRDTLITDVKRCVRLPRLVVEAVTTSTEVAGAREETTIKDLDKIIELAKTELLGLIFKMAKRNTVQFNRSFSSHCCICDRVHDSDGAFIAVYENEGITKWYHHCRRDQKNSRLIYSSATREAKPKVHKPKSDGIMAKLYQN
jgi:hypothetical protein